MGTEKYREEGTPSTVSQESKVKGKVSTGMPVILSHEDVRTLSEANFERPEGAGMASYFTRVNFRLVGSHLSKRPHNIT